MRKIKKLILFCTLYEQVYVQKENYSKWKFNEKGFFFFTKNFN